MQPPAEHVTEHLRKRLAAMPGERHSSPGAKRPTGAGVLFHLEFQSRPVPLMAERLLEDATLLRNDLARSSWKPAPMGRVVAHVPLVVDNGRERWRVPLQLATPAGWASPAPARLQPRFAYRLIAARDYAGVEVADGNLARVAWRWMRYRRPGWRQRSSVRAQLLTEAGDRGLQRSLQGWCDGVLRPRFGDGLPTLADMMETPTMLADTLREWEERINDEGRREGRQEALEEERAPPCDQARRRLGAILGQALAGILAGVEDNAEVMWVGTLTVECATGQGLLARARHH